MLSRQRAAELIKRALAENKVDTEKVATVRLMLIDVLRRASLWDNALAQCREVDVASLDETMTAVLCFEKHLSETCDAGCYSVGSAETFAAKQQPLG